MAKAEIQVIEEKAKKILSKTTESNNCEDECIALIAACELVDDANIIKDIAQGEKDQCTGA